MILGGLRRARTEVCHVRFFRQILTKHRRLVRPLALTLAVVAIFWAVNSPGIVGVSAAGRKLPIYCVKRDNKAVSLTFDAAWGNEDTQTLIDILTSYSVRATFFLVGQWADKYPESVKALSDAGMEIGNHSNVHPHMAQMTEKQIMDEVNACNEKIEAITGAAPTLFRCPYGEYNDTVIGTLDDMGIRTIQWNVDSLDWKDLSAAEIFTRVKNGVTPGSIILFHNAAKHTPEALPEIIEYLLSEGYEIVPVSELLLTGEYEIDHTGMMKAAAEA